MRYEIIWMIGRAINYLEEYRILVKYQFSFHERLSISLAFTMLIEIENLDQ